MKENIEIVGIKIGMTQVFSESNELIPVTIIQAGPCPVAQIKTHDVDGYYAVQIAHGEQKEKRLSKGARGHLKKANLSSYQHLQEFRVSNTSELKLGDAITVEQFEIGELVDVIGTTKGRGFQGVVKRFGFAGGPKSHGSMSHRRGGSYGQHQWPGEVRKGKKMPGRMGNKRRTTQNLEIIGICLEDNLIIIRGSVHGSKGGRVTIRKAKKAKSKS